MIEQDFTTQIKEGKDTHVTLYIAHDFVPATRSQISSNTTGQNPQFVEADSILCLNVNNSTYSTLYYDAATDAFQGIANISSDDELAVLYPYVKPTQTGIKITLDQSLKHTYLWGFTEIDQVGDAATASIKLFDLMARCTVKVTDEGNSTIVAQSLLLSPLKGKLYSSRVLNLRTGSFEDGSYSENLLIDSSLRTPSGDFRFYLFPSSALLKAEVTDTKGNIFEGTSEQHIFVENTQTDITFQCTIPASAKDYVEVCGIKWAKGNLLYAADEEGAEGFQPHWRLGNTQYEYYNPVYGTKGTSLSVDLPYDTLHVHLFNWGACGKNALNITECGKGKNTDISARLFKDKYFKYETTDFDEALYGDVSYWASKGKWRMPTIDELYTLYNEASYSYGYATTPEGNLVYGFYFTTPVGERVIDTNVHYYTAEDLDNGLFLPGAGFRQQASPIIKRTGKCGFFWDSYRGETAQQMCMRFVGVTLHWSDDGANYGRTIRPVLNE